MAARRQNPIQDRAAIAGIGATEFSKNSGRSELRLALEAVQAALEDCGLSAADVDAMVTSAADRTDEVQLSRNLHTRDLTFFARVPQGGGGGGGALLHAAMAVVCGVADVVVCYRALNERSGVRFGQPSSVTSASAAWYEPFGVTTPAAKAALTARRYMHEFGVTSEDLGRVTVSARRYAATNPRAYFYRRPITLADHQRSPWVAEPLRLLDCCQESDGAVALVVTSTERARWLSQPVVTITAAAQSAPWDQDVFYNYYRPAIVTLPETEAAGRQLWRGCGLRPPDVDVASLYDHFTPFVLMQLEALGFARPGEAAGFVRDGGIDVDGALPLNTNGGQLGEAYIHGYNGIAECVRQLRGMAVNQVPGARRALVMSGGGIPTSGAILSRHG